jgi:hypothetical protein
MNPRTEEMAIAMPRFGMPNCFDVDISNLDNPSDHSRIKALCRSICSGVVQAQHVAHILRP